MEKKKQKQTYKYRKANSILYNLTDEYVLTNEEYYELYSFYVTYSMCGNQSMKKRKFTDYGWKSHNIQETKNGKNHKTDLGIALERVITFDSDHFSFSTGDDDLGVLFRKYNLEDGPIIDLSTERAVIGITHEDNKYLKMFHRVRNGLAHGKFILRYSSSKEKMVVIQDDDSNNVTARIVIKLSTLMEFINVIDLDDLIKKKIVQENKTVA